MFRLSAEYQEFSDGLRIPMQVSDDDAGFPRFQTQRLDNRDETLLEIRIHRSLFARWSFELNVYPRITSRRSLVARLRALRCSNVFMYCTVELERFDSPFLERIEFSFAISFVKLLKLLIVRRFVDTTVPLNLEGTTSSRGKRFKHNCAIFGTIIEQTKYASVEPAKQRW